MLIDGAASGGQCFQFEGSIPPGGGPPLHGHEREDEPFFVLEGTFKFAIDGREVVCGPGAFVCAPRGVPHTFRNVGGDTGRLHVTCTRAGLEEAFREIRDPEPRSGLPAPTPDDVAAALGRRGVTILGPPLDG